MIVGDCDEIKTDVPPSVLDPLIAAPVLTGLIKFPRLSNVASRSGQLIGRHTCALCRRVHSIDLRDGNESTSDIGDDSTAMGRGQRGDLTSRSGGRRSVL